jgi:HSP20 family protein
MSQPVRRTEARPVARWDPFREIEDVWSRMGSLLGDISGGGEGHAFGPWANLAVPADIEETDDAYVVRLDMPGVKRDDFTLELRDNELLVSGEIKETERVGKLRKQTRRTGRFEHRIALPSEVNPDSVDATLSDGVLAVRLGKAPHTQPKRIEVKA